MFLKTRFVLIALFLLFLNVPALFAQSVKEDLAIYKVVLNDYIDSVSAADSLPVGLIDSTRTAVFWGGFPDDINKTYFGFSDRELIEFDDFRMSFIAATASPEKLPGDLFTSQVVKKINRSHFKKIFSYRNVKGKAVLTKQAFNRLNRKYRCKSFCEFSRPYYINDHTAMIYFHYSCGPENGMDNIYLLRYKDNRWEIISKLRQWRI